MECATRTQTMSAPAFVQMRAPVASARCSLASSRPTRIRAVVSRGSPLCVGFSGRETPLVRPTVLVCAEEGEVVQKGGAPPQEKAVPQEEAVAQEEPLAQEQVVAQEKPTAQGKAVAQRAFKQKEKSKSSKGKMRIEDINVNQVYEGKVVTKTNFGAFVDIGAEEDALVHISELSNDFVHDVGEVVYVGMRVEVKVVSTDPDRGRIGGSFKHPGMNLKPPTTTWE